MSTTRVRVRDYYYDGQDRVVMQGGEYGPDGQIIRGSEQPKRNGLQFLYGGKPHSPGDEFDMNDRDLKSAGLGEPDSGIELASEHTARQERIERRERAVAERSGETGNWFARLASAQEEEIRAKALTMKLQSEKAREHIERALGQTGPVAGQSLSKALEAEGEHTAETARRAMELQRRLDDLESKNQQESASLQQRMAAERSLLEEQLAAQGKLLAELQAKLAAGPQASAVASIEGAAPPKGSSVAAETSAAVPPPSAPVAPSHSSKRKG